MVICMELLNSRVNHPDYQCDKSAWGVELVKQIGSANFKLLYDIYHMQIMEGDVIATIQESSTRISRITTLAGVPGRHEIDETQELNYPADHARHRGDGVCRVMSRRNSSPLAPTRSRRCGRPWESAMCDA